MSATKCGSLSLSISISLSLALCVYRYIVCISDYVCRNHKHLYNNNVDDDNNICSDQIRKIQGRLF